MGESGRNTTHRTSGPSALRAFLADGWWSRGLCLLDDFGHCQEMPSQPLMDRRQESAGVGFAQAPGDGCKNNTDLLRLPGSVFRQGRKGDSDAASEEV